MNLYVLHLAIPEAPNPTVLSARYPSHHHALRPDPCPCRADPGPFLHPSGLRLVVLARRDGGNLAGPCLACPSLHPYPYPVHSHVFLCRCFILFVRTKIGCIDFRTYRIVSSPVLGCGSGCSSGANNGPCPSLCLCRLVPSSYRAACDRDGKPWFEGWSTEEDSRSRVIGRVFQSVNPLKCPPCLPSVRSVAQPCIPPILYQKVSSHR
jgi:hypothetical protein